MKADDPRHGTNAGHRAHFTDNEPPCQPCRNAHADYRRGLRTRQYLAGREHLYVDATGTARRIQALQALGWRYPDIDRVLGRAVRGNYSFNLTIQSRVHIDTAAMVAEAYDKLSMTLGPSEITRRRAARAGYLPPLAWDDEKIDDPNERPRIGRRGARKTDVDPVVVERILDGDRIRATKAEKNEAMRRWKALGRSEKSLCKAQGWKDSRYGREETAA